MRRPPAHLLDAVAHIQRLTAWLTGPGRDSQSALLGLMQSGVPRAGILLLDWHEVSPQQIVAMASVGGGHRWARFEARGVGNAPGTQSPWRITSVRVVPAGVGEGTPSISTWRDLHAAARWLDAGGDLG